MPEDDHLLVSGQGERRLSRFTFLFPTFGSVKLGNALCFATPGLTTVRVCMVHYDVWVNGILGSIASGSAWVGRGE